MGAKITNKNGEFYKIRNFSIDGKIKSIKYGNHYIEELLYDTEKKEPSIPVFKGITIKLNK